MNKENKFLLKLNKHKKFLLLLLLFIIITSIYLLVFETGLINYTNIDNVETKKTKQVDDDSINVPEEDLKFSGELNDISGSESKKQYHDWLDNDVIKVYNKKFYLDEDYESKYRFIDDIPYIKFDNDKYNILKKVDGKIVYVDYIGNNHNILEVDDTNIKNITVGDYIYYGNLNYLMNDEKNIDLSIDRKLVFRVVDINDGVALLHSVFAINNNYGNVYEDGYINSSLRTYLNDEFYNNAFNEEEKSRIVKSEYKYRDNIRTNKFEKYIDYIGTFSSDDICNFYTTGFLDFKILKPRDIRDVYNNENLSSFKQIWIMSTDGFLYKGRYILNAYDEDRNKENYVMPVLKIRIDDNYDADLYNLPDFNMLNYIQKEFILNNDLYFIDQDRNLIKILNYNGEKSIDKSRIEIISKKVGYLYKIDDKIYFSNESEYGTSCVTIYELKNNDKIEKISDSVFPYIKFKNKNNFVFLKNAGVVSETIGAYYANVAKGELYEYDNDKIKLDDELLLEKYNKNKRVAKEKNIETVNIDKGKVYDKSNLVFYDKDCYHYVNVDGKEYKYTHYDDDYASDFNKDKNIFVKYNNIYFSHMSDTDKNKKILYAFYKENGKFVEKIIDEANLYIDFLYVVGNELFYVKREKKEDYYDYNWTICSYEFGGKKEELYILEGEEIYYCSEIDKAFVVRRISYQGVYHYSLEMVDENGIKLVDEFVNESNIVETPYGIYYMTRGEDRGLYFYNGKKTKLFDKPFINKVTRSNDYRFIYFELLYEKTVNLNDYLILPDKNDEYYKKKIGNQNPNEYTYYGTKVYVANKDKIKKLADDAEINTTDDKIILKTFKRRNDEKREFKEALEFVKFKTNAIYTTGGESISNYLLYLERDPKFNYIFDGDRGSRFNKGDSYNGSSYPWIIKDDILGCNGGGIFAGKIEYENVSNLYKLVNKTDENELKIMHINIKNDEVYIYYKLQYKNSFNYDKGRVDIYCYHDGQNELILENIEDALITEDSENNVYIIKYDGYEHSMRKEYLYKISILNGKLKKEIFVEDVANLKYFDTYEKTYDDVRDFGFYYENNDNSKSIIGVSFMEDNPLDTIPIDIDKSNLIDFNNKVNIEELQYSELSKEYIEGSKNYYQKTNQKVYSFYESKGALYVYLNNALKLVDDNFGYGEHKKIVYDAINDEYYYSKSIRNKYGAYDGEMQNICLKIKNNKVDKKVVAKIKVENPHYDYQIKYLGRLSKYYIWTDSNKKVFKGIGDGNVEEICMVGNSPFDSNYYDDEYMRGQTCFFVSLNTYENKLYYINYKSLYVIDENLKSKKISDNVNEFIQLQNEVLYVSGGLFRYKDDKSVKLFDIGEIQILGRHNDKKCYVGTFKNKYLKDVFYLDEDINEDMKNSFESSKNYWLGRFGDIYLYENGKLNKLIENVDSPTNMVINGETTHGVASMDGPYIFTKSIVGNGEKINFNEFYEYCKNVDMANSNENYKVVRKYQEDKRMYGYIINTYDISEVLLEDEFTSYTSNDIVISSIKNDIMKIRYKYDYDGDVECEIQFNNTAKNNYNVIYDKNEYDNYKKDDDIFYDKVNVVLSENYLYDMFN